MARDQHRGVEDVGQEARRCEQLAGALGLGDALLAEAHVDPAGEQVLLVPVAVAVAQEDQGVRRRHAPSLGAAGLVIRGELEACRSVTITRGTTNTNRLRRVDRWIADPARAAQHRRSARRRPRLRRQRRHRARAAAAAGARTRRRRGARPRDRARPGAHRDRAARPGARRRHGVLPRRPRLVRPRRLRDAAPRRPPRRGHPRLQRAAAVRRVGGAGGLATHGRRACSPRACWSRAPATRSAASPAGSTSPRPAPQTFTISLRLAGLEKPSIVAERLPKALIHRNVPGERVHALLCRARPGVAAQRRRSPCTARPSAGSPRSRPWMRRAGRCSAAARAGGSAN